MKVYESLRCIGFGAVLLAACNGGGGSEDAGEEEGTGDPALDDGPETAACESDDECSNGIFCDGVETCGEDGYCNPGERVICDDGDPCTLDECDEDLGACSFGVLDRDSDGFAAAEAPTGESCGGPDCDDGSRDIYPDADESACDLVDSDCDGSKAETMDDDGDGWVDEACGDGWSADELATEGLSGTGDCNDERGDAFPGAPEGCDGTVDNDCDGDATEIVMDGDEDGYAPADCDPPEGMEDCNDGDESIHPGADEVCDLVDQNCDGSILDAEGIDDDDDDVPDELCGGNDCNDEAVSVHGVFDPPAGVTDEAVAEAEEACDEVDQDCDGDILDVSGADDDEDGYLDENCGGPDCDDTSDRYHPGADPNMCIMEDYDCDEVPDTRPFPPVVIDDGSTGGVNKGSVAWSGSEYGVVWSKLGGSDNDIYFMRLDAAGSPTGSGVWVTADSIDSDWPDIAWGNGRWGIVYESGSAILITLAADGSDPRPPGGIELGQGPCTSSMAPRIAFDGTNFGLVWLCNTTEIRFSSASAMGAPGSSVDIVDASGPTSVSRPCIAWQTSRYGIVWAMTADSVAEQQIYYDLIDPTTGSNMTDRVLSAVPSGANAYASAVAAGTVNPGSGSTDGFGVVWRETTDGGKIMSSVFTLAGNSGGMYEVKAGPSNYPSLAWNGVRFGILWQNDTSGAVEFRQMSQNGETEGAFYPVTSAAGTHRFPRLVWTPEAFGSIWRLDPAIGYFARLPCTYD